MAVKQKNGSISYEEYCIDLLNKLAENLHFTYEIYTSPDEAYGAESENGSWNGLIGELTNAVCKVLHCLMHCYCYNEILAVCSTSTSVQEIALSGIDVKPLTLSPTPPYV